MPPEEQQQEQQTKYSTYQELYRYSSLADKRRKMAEKEMKCWNFDQELYTLSELTTLAAVALVKKRVDQYLGLSVNRIGQICAEIEGTCTDHNFRHGFTVLHCTGRLLSRMDIMNGGSRELNDFYRTGLLLAALCHDMFQSPAIVVAASVSASTGLKDTASDIAVRTVKAVSNYKLFLGLKPTRAREMRRLMQILILSTDLESHEKILSDISGCSSNQHSFHLNYCKLVIHAADIAYVTFQPALSQKWSDRIISEFEIEIPTQLEFIQNYVRPTWRVLEQTMPSGAIQTYVDAIESNATLLSETVKF